MTPQGEQEHPQTYLGRTMYTCSVHGYTIYVFFQIDGGGCTRVCKKCLELAFLD